jgi:DNA replication and repair protein RecF
LTSAARIRRLTLTNFRSYHTAALETDGDAPIALIGPNGAGKTNILEAISWLAPGRGLRNATLEDVAFNEGDGSWAVSAEVEGALGLATLGTGIEPPAADAPPSRKCRVDREPVTVTAFADHLRVLWLVPAMDSLFAGPASERRRFLDRLVLAIDAQHGARVNALDRALRSRNRLLEYPQPDAHWLDAIEHEAAELAVAVAAARADAVNRLAVVLAARSDPSGAFPSAGIAIEGFLEGMVPNLPAVEVEDRYRSLLRDNRARDAAAGRTLEGPHASDLHVIYTPKSIAAREASTGEQKALLIGLVLAHASLVAAMTSIAPVVLLDEVVAHLDPRRRAALFDALARLGAQVWITGADPAAFADIDAQTQVFNVDSGVVKRQK